MSSKRLDHFIGYTVQEVGVHDDAPAITLDDGWKLIFNKRTKLDKGLPGQRLANVEVTPDEGVRLLFNEGSVPTRKGGVMLFNADTGLITDPFEEVDPNEGLPPDPSADRISEGPTDEEVRRELDARQEEAGTAE